MKLDTRFNIYVRKCYLLLVLNLTKTIKENKDIQVKKNIKKNLSLISSIKLRKLRLKQKNGFLI